MTKAQAVKLLEDTKSFLLGVAVSPETGSNDDFAAKALYALAGVDDMLYCLDRIEAETNFFDKEPANG